MKKLAGILLALVAMPAAAQENSAELTSDRDLSCAVWSAVIVGAYEDAEIRGAYIPMMYYFVGRYEAATGLDFREAFTRRSREFDADFSRLEAFDDICEPLKADIVGRFSEWSERMGAEERAASE